MQLIGLEAKTTNRSAARRRAGARIAGAVPCRLRADRRAMVTLELAFLGPVFVGAALCLFQICFTFFVQQAMDYATLQAARQVQIGAAQGAPDAATFTANYLCPNLLGFLSCTNVVVAVSTVPDYTGVPTTPFPPATVNTASGPNQTHFAFCNASPKQLMLVQAAYMAPAGFASLFPNTITYNGSVVMPVTATAAFMTELFPANGTGQNAC